MLNGVSSPGPALQMDPVDGLYSVTPGCHMQSISQGGTQTLLQSFAELGSILWRVRKFCTSMMSPSAHHQNARVFETSEWTSINPEMSFDEQLQHRQQLLQRLPTVAAFAAALDFELKGLQRQIPIELSASTEALSLLQLKYQIEGLTQQARALHLAVLNCVPRGSAAESAAALLDALQFAVQEHMLLSASQGGTLAAMLFRIFTATCKPYLSCLQAYIRDGDLSHDIYGELFIASGTHNLTQYGDLQQ